MLNDCNDDYADDMQPLEVTQEEWDYWTQPDLKPITVTNREWENWCNETFAPPTPEELDMMELRYELRCTEQDELDKGMTGTTDLW